MRLALFGGTFDPPHLGHLRIAAAAAGRFHLDQVLFAPTGQQPLKASAPLAGFDDRVAMTELACKADARFAVSKLDAPNPQGPNFTVDILTALKQQHAAATLFNVVGADSFLTLARWREPVRLLMLTEWIVVSRPGFALDQEGVNSVLREVLAPREPAAADLDRVHLLTGIAEDISASEIRRRLRNGGDCSGLLPEAVAEYIATHNLYRE